MFDTYKNAIRYQIEPRPRYLFKQICKQLDFLANGADPLQPLKLFRKNYTK